MSTAISNVVVEQAIQEFNGNQTEKWKENHEKLKELYRGSIDIENNSITSQVNDIYDSNSLGGIDNWF
jgi:hypothetical protein